jgi:hypothetical protein
MQGDQIHISAILPTLSNVNTYISKGVKMKHTHNQNVHYILQLDNKIIENLVKEVVVDR